MREITKVSDIVVEDIADYIRLSEVNQDDSNTLEALLTVAKSFIENYTGLSEESLNEKKDLIYPLLFFIFFRRISYIIKINFMSFSTMISR